MKKILFIFCLLQAVSLQAAEVLDLYKVEVLVQNQSHSERIKGMRVAIKEVLVRVSGSKAVVDNPLLFSAIASASRYVESYRYDQRQQGTEILDFLLVNFSEKALQKLLVEKQLPVWSKQRPDVLLWLAVEEPSRSYILKDSSVNIVNQAINNAVMSRGLPLLRPLNSDIEAGKVRVIDIKVGFEQQISNASQDYTTHGVLIGYVKQLSRDSWLGKWKFVRAGQVVNWSSGPAEISTVILAGVDVVADTLSSDFAISAREQDSLLIRINNVSDLTQYAIVGTYLEGLLITNDIAVVKIDVNAVEYELRLLGKSEEFLRAINLGGKMRVVPQMITTNNIDSVQKQKITSINQLDYILELIR